MRLSVVIATRNRAALLRLTLGSLRFQTLPREDFEVVVCDHESTDDTAAVCAAFADSIQLRVVSHPFEGFDIAGPKNRAIAAARGRAILLLDCGIACPPNFLAAHADAHAAHGVMACGPVFGWENDVETALWRDVASGRFPDLAIVQAEYADRRDRMAPDFDAAPWMLFWGCNASVPTTPLAAVGAFDPAFRGWGWDDLELGYRLHRFGLRYEYLRSAWCLHYPHPRAPLAERLAQARRNWEYTYDKHRRPELELWEVCDFADYDRTLRRLTRRLATPRVAAPQLFGSPGTVLFGFDPPASAQVVSPPPPPRAGGAVESFGIRTPFSAAQFQRAVISPYWARLLFSASPGRPVLARFVIEEALRIANLVTVCTCSNLSGREARAADRLRSGLGTGGRVTWA